MSQTTLYLQQHVAQRAWRAPAAAAAIVALVAFAIVLATASFDRAKDGAGLARPGAQGVTAASPVSIAADVGTSVPSADSAFAGRHLSEEEPAPTF